VGLQVECYLILLFLRQYKGVHHFLHHQIHQNHRLELHKHLVLRHLHHLLLKLLLKKQKKSLENLEDLQLLLLRLLLENLLLLL
tara:strand:+ start:173 stop:424 length:252 start_codon:yes stop_codon:yes gene_type:complete